MKISELLASDDIETVRLGLKMIDSDFLIFIFSKRIYSGGVNDWSRESIRDICHNPDEVIFTRRYTEENFKQAAFYQRSRFLEVPAFIKFTLPFFIEQNKFVKLYEQFENSRASKFYRYRKFFARIKSYFQRKIQ